MDCHEEIQALDNLSQLDALAALDKLEEQEQARDQELFRLTEQIQKFDMKGPELESRLPELLKTKRERALYDALMGVIRAERERLIEYEKQMHAQTQELEVLRQTFQAIFDEAPKIQSSNVPFCQKAA